MSAFIETRLLEDVGHGTQVVPTNSILRIPMRSGVIRRKGRRRNIRTYTILVKRLHPADHRSVYNAFTVCDEGQGFRFKDVTDWRVQNQFLTVGTGAPQTVQLFKLYEFGIENRQRPIRKPVAGTVEITAPTAPTSVSVDHTTGMATFTAALGETVRFSCEFDVPVMFADDELVMDSIAPDGEHGVFLSADVGLIEDLSA